MVSSADARFQIRAFITGNFYLSNVDGLADGASLLEAGVVDSTGVLEIIGFLQSAFGIVVEDDEIVPENLDSIDRLTDYVGRKTMSGV